MQEPKVNLGQSRFQDTYFVAQAQYTPYRQLRQIELELRQIEDSLKKADFTKRRMELRIKKLDPADPDQAIDIEEAQWDLSQHQSLLEDTLSRKENFESLKRELLAGVPEEYWAIGYEAAELEHWVQVISQEMAIMRITGHVNIQTMKQLTMLPMEAQQQVLALSSRQATILIPHVEAEVISSQTNTPLLEGATKPDLRLVPPASE